MENPKTETEEEKKPLSEIPTIENYINPYRKESLEIFSAFLEKMLDPLKPKFEQCKNILWFKKEDISIKDPTLKNLVKEETKTLDSYSDKFNYIIDTSSYFHYANTEEEIKNITTIKQIDKTILEKEISLLEEKGTIIFLLDFQFVSQISEALKNTFGENMKQKLFIKNYIVHKLPFACFIFVQKLSTSNTESPFTATNVLCYEQLNGENQSKPQSCKIMELKTALSYFYELYQYEGFMKEFHPGFIIPIKIKEKPFSDNIDCTFQIIDSEDKNLIALKKCIAVVISKDFSNEFMYISVEGTMDMCRQFQVSRVILMRPAPFNYDPPTTIKDKFSPLIAMFKPEECPSESIPVMHMSVGSIERMEIFIDDDLIIQDVIENDAKDTFRQIVFKASPDEIQSEIKLKLTSKSNIKSNTDTNYIQLYTESRYSSKNLVFCLDDKVLSLFYLKALLLSSLFTNMDNYPFEKRKILILGGGIGTFNFYFNKFYNGNILIDVVEKSEKLKKIGKEYFGVNEDSKNISWKFMDAYKFLNEEKKQNYYDLVIMDINNFNVNDGLSPPAIYFEDKILEKIKGMLKDSGLYGVNLISRNYKNFGKCFNSLEKYFPLIFLVQNNEDLSKIHFCFKNKRTREEYNTLCNTNFQRLKEEDGAGVDLIKNDLESILERITDSEKFKSRIEAYIKK